MKIDPPKGISPRFSCEPSEFPRIQTALDSIGHVIIENVLEKPTLRICNTYTENLFEKIDSDFNAGLFTEGQIYAYLGSTYSFMSDAEGKKHEKLFLDMIERSPIMDLFSFLHKGTVAGVHGPVIRRADPTKPLQHIGLHTDGQPTEYVERAYRSNNCYTTWIPLCNVDSHTARLFLFHKNVYFENPAVSILNPSLSENIFISHRKKDNIHIDATPLYIYSLPRKILDHEALAKYNKNYHETTNHILNIIGDEAYAPELSMNSAIVFRQNIIHGSFCHNNLTKARHSIDIRFMGDFDRMTNFDTKERAFIFQRYTRQTYDPNIKKQDEPISPIPSIEAQIRLLNQKLIEQQQRINNQQQQILRLTKRAHPFKALSNQLKEKIKPVVKPLLKKLGLR